MVFFIRYYDCYYAPLASTFCIREYSLSDFPSRTKPFSAFEQMMAIFPPQYIEEIQKGIFSSQSVTYFPIACLEIIESRFICDFYQTDPVFDPNNRPYQEQGVLKLPFVDAQLLRSALEPARSKLSEEEKKRDNFDVDRLFNHSSNPFLRQLVHLDHSRGSMPLTGNITGQIFYEDKKQYESSKKHANEHGKIFHSTYVLCLKYRC